MIALAIVLGFAAACFTLGWLTRGVVSHGQRRRPWSESTRIRRTRHGALEGRADRW